MTNEREEVSANEALRESMQRWIDYHSARADKADALVGELMADLNMAISRIEYLGIVNTDLRHYDSNLKYYLPKLASAAAKAQAFMEGKA